MIKAFIALFLFSSVAMAGLPPTTSKGSGDSSDITTFKFQFPNLTVTHTGTTASFDLPNLLTAGSCTNCNITYDAKGRITAASNGSGGSAAPDTDIFALSGGVTLVDDFGGPAYASAAKTVSKIDCSMYNSGSSGSTVVTFHYGAALGSSATVSISANSGVNATSSATPGISLSLGDYISASVTQVAGGAPQDLRCKVYY